MNKKVTALIIIAITTFMLSACSDTSSADTGLKQAEAPQEATDYWPQDPSIIRRVTLLEPAINVKGPDWELVDGVVATHYGQRTQCRLILELPNGKNFEVTVYHQVTLMQRDGIIYHVALHPLPGGVEIEALANSLTKVFEDNELAEQEEWVTASAKLQSYIDGTQEAEEMRFKVVLSDQCGLNVNVSKLYRNRSKYPEDFSWVYSLTVIATNEAIEEAERHNQSQ